LLLKLSCVSFASRRKPEMMMADFTVLLQKWREGDRQAENELFALVLPHLRRLARYIMRGERKDLNLQPTELVNQIYFRLVAAKDRDWKNRQHFFALAAKAMRQYLIDVARRRPDGEFVPIDGMKEFLPAESQQLVLAMHIDRLLDKLAEKEPEWCRVVEMKYFLGLTDEEAAEVLGLKLRTMQRMWFDARQWLFAQLKSDEVPPSERETR
jgi:RNA polymerase sigma factor (TIGR02999 family)